MTRTAFLHPFARPAAEDFICIVRGEGATVWDDQGRPYVDAMASLWYCNVGHGRSEITEAVAAQMREIAAYHTFEIFTNETSEQLCAKLSELAPMPNSRVFLTSSGSEAVDTAIKIARLAHSAAGAPERRIIISRRPSYHGVTYGGLAATGLPINQEHFGAMLGDVVQTAHDDLDAVADAFAQHPGQIAAVIAEPVVGAGGVYPPVPGYLEGLRRLCDEHGAWLILDEVICGFGRLGTWWGATRYGIRPDLVTFAKAVTSGYLPLGGVLVAPSVRSPLEADPDLVLRHGHTYSGHPTAAAAGVANLAIMERENLPARALTVGARLSDGLRSLLDDPAVVEVRGDGAVWALGLDEGLPAAHLRNALLERGVIARPVGTQTLAFCPPLIITDEQIDQCVEALNGSLASLRRDTVRAPVS